jgi:hypothetical protein
MEFVYLFSGTEHFFKKQSIRNSYKTDIKRRWSVMDHLRWQSLFVKSSVILRHSLTSPGHLGRRNTDRIISIYVVPPKVVKASTVTYRSCQRFRLQMLPSPALSRNLRQCKQSFKEMLPPPWKRIIF